MSIGEDRRTKSDYVDQIVQQWRQELSDLDTSPMQVVARISRASRILDRELEAVYSEFGLRTNSFSVLAALRRAGPPYALSPTELYNSLLVTSGAVTYRTGRLLERGLIRRAPDESDGRSVLVSLTRDGRELIDRAMRAHTTRERDLLSPLSREQRRSLAATLRQLLASLEQLS